MVEIDSKVKLSFLSIIKDINAKRVNVFDMVETAILRLINL